MNYRILAFAIIKQAIEDYEIRRAGGASTVALENFFLSDWCDFLLSHIELTGADILAYLKRT